jgi:hypothetical protein
MAIKRFLFFIFGPLSARRSMERRSPPRTYERAGAFPMTVCHRLARAVACSAVLAPRLDGYRADR